MTYDGDERPGRSRGAQHSNDRYDRDRGERDRDGYGGRERDDRDRGRKDDGDRYHPYKRSPPRRPHDSTPSAHNGDVTRQHSSSTPRPGFHPHPVTAPSAVVQPTSSTSSSSTPSANGLPPTKRPLSLPLSSLADLAKKRSADADIIPAKPVFLTRQQREAAALQRIKDERQRREKEREAHQQVVQQLVQSSSSSPPPPSPSHPRDRRSRNPRQPVSVARSSADDLKEREATLIKAQHLGQRLDVKVKPVEKGGSKYKFNFDWNSAEDTSNDPYALYEKRGEVGLLYGRGFVGGVDRKEQRKQHQHFEQVIKRRLQDSVEDEMKSEGLKEDGRMQDVKPSSQASHAREDKETLVMQQQRHWSEKRLEEMEERDWRIFKEDFEIATRGNRVPHPLRSWKESGLPPVLLSTLDKVGYKEPSAIQRAAIPVGLINRDVIGIAETGSGKTAAFLLPMLVYISRLPPITTVTAEAGPYALIMAPTRELAQQISVECSKLGAVLGIRNVSIVGGLSIEEQGVLLRQGVEVVIGTPGRLIDCIEKSYLVLNQCNYVVLDEADRMIDMNFEPQIVKVMDSMPSTNLKPDEEQEGEMGGGGGEGSQRYRQTIMFSATMPPKVSQLARKYLRVPVEIAVGDRRGKASSNVTQTVEWVKSDADKRRRLVDLLQVDSTRTIVFCNLKKTCDLVSKAVNDLGVTTVVLHGGKGQEMRQEALEDFKRGKIDVLIATDVMARGIDVKEVRLVINYEMPSDIQKYTHRIGRTGRAGNKGEAVSFVGDGDVDIMYDLKQMLQEAGQVIPRELNNHEAARVKPGTVGEGGSKKGRVQYAE